MNLTTVLLMALLALAAGAWLTRPLWAKASAATVRRRRANVVAYETRVAEIDADLAAGTLDAESAQQLRDEAAARLLTDAGEDPEHVLTPRKPLFAALTVLVLLAGAGLAYVLSGNWETRSLIELADEDPRAAEQQMIDGMVAKLKARLQSEPDDAQGWAMLGRSYVVTQRYAEAVEAYGRANALTAAQPQASWLVAAGAAQGLASPERDLREARPLFEKALQLEPGNPEALWYAGMAALQAGDMKAAYRHWMGLREQALPPSIAALLEEQLPQIAAEAGEPLPAPKLATAQGQGARLTVNVRLAESLQAQLKPGMTLLVFAKAENGPPMPLAVQRISSPQLPLTVTLDDSMAMLPSMKLSSFERWVVTARLTMSGGAEALSGDLEGRHPASRAEAGSPIDLVIDQQLP